jgi:hypothetical protein
MAREVRGISHEEQREKHSMRRTPAALRFSFGALVLAGSLAVGGLSGTAGAAGGVVTCSMTGGSQNGTPSLFGCSQQTATGGDGTIIGPAPFFSGHNTGTVNWDNLSTSQANTTKIKVRTKVVKKKSHCPAGTTELKVSGTVVADTTGVISVHGHVSANLCLSSNGQYSLLHDTVFTF